MFPEKFNGACLVANNFPLIDSCGDFRAQVSWKRSFGSESNAPDCAAVDVASAAYFRIAHKQTANLGIAPAYSVDFP